MIIKDDMTVTNTSNRYRTIFGNAQFYNGTCVLAFLAPFDVLRSFLFSPPHWLVSSLLHACAYRPTPLEDPYR
jgi:hypothetical protein